MGITKFGNKRMQKALQRWEKDIIDDVKDVIKRTAELIQDEARSLAAHDTGYLKQSIEVTIAADGLSATVIVGAEYGFFLEFGTGIYNTQGKGRQTSWTYYNERWGHFVVTQGMRAQPFWYPAIEIAQKFFRREMRKIGK